MARNRSPFRRPLHAALVLLLACACGGGGGSAPGPQAVCGNAVVEPGEACDDGNATAGDGCEPDCTVTAAAGLVYCRALPPAASGTCAVAAGGANVLLRGTILGDGSVYVGGEVAIDAAGTIACVGCDCSASAAGATVVTCARGVVSPGFVNAHDHLSFANGSPVLDTGERYEQRHDWREGARGHTRISVAGGATTAQMQWGELRFVLGGATSTVGAAGAPGFLRNLDNASLEEGLGAAAAHDDTFPLGDSSGTQLSSGCAYPSITAAASIATYSAYLAHVAEGIDAVARNELVCTTSFASGGQDLAQPQSAFVQGIGALPADYAELAASGTALVWSPRSNVRLYGDTAPVAEADRLGVEIALGTDWIPTGSMNVLRELRCADAWNAERLGRHFTDEQLWAMATRNAADVTGTGARLGRLTVGRVADVAVFDASARPLYRAAIAADPQDVVLVLRGGKALYGDAGLVAAVAGAGCDPLDVCGRAKQVCVQSETGMTLAALQASAGSMYPAFFCGAPLNEPTCTPSRLVSVAGSTVYSGTPDASDADGDGVPDASDDCPTVFNPVRPLDGGAQADADGDGVGDACDPCPLLANASVCPAPDPDDLDGDGVPNAIDDCPLVPDPGQADADGDGKGDACDPCPDYANPGTAACVFTIYDLKTGTVAPGTILSLQDELVTAVAPSGFFLQERPGGSAYLGPDHSGVWVSAPSTAVLPGDRVTISSATLTSFFGALELTSPSGVVLVSRGEAAPAPVAVTPAEVATGGARAAALEGVLVQVSAVTVTDVAPPPGPGDVAPTNEFVVDGLLRVDDLFHAATPFPALGTVYAFAAGVLASRNGDSKLEPRSAADLVASSAPLTGFGPVSGTFARVGQVAAPTFPDPLAVTIGSPVATDTFVAVSTTDPGLVVVGGGVTIPAGQLSAPVLLDGLARSLAATLTATLGATSLDATVRVLDPTDQPALVALDPPAATVLAGSAIDLTVTLDLPPAAATDVTLSLAPAGVGTIPASVTVAPDRLSATFSYVAPATAAQATVSATLGTATLSSTLTVAEWTRLVLNEIDYDQVGTDAAEFIEIYNPTSYAVSLAGIVVHLVNGGVLPGSVYRTIDLSPAGTLPPGGYLVVAPPSLVIAPSALRVAFPNGVVTDAIQNGAPDGVALVDTNAAILLDALSYEGSITAAVLPGLTGTVSLVEGTAVPPSVADSNAVNGSLVRLPNGIDTNDAASDWRFSFTPTPGAANAP